jgi:predicted phage terminase large subunit-like protein
MIVIGTRWTDGDLYNWILDKENNIVSSYDVMTRKALVWEGDLEQALVTGENIKEILWPEKFTVKELATRYREKGPYEFSCQYLNDPVPDTDATFKREWFHYYDPSDMAGKLLNTYVTVDPAIALGKEADYTGIVVTSIDQYGNIFVREVIRAKLTPTNLINELFRVAERWHPLRIGIEDVAFQKALSYGMREEALRRGRHLPIEEVKPGARTKDQRIKALQPLYAAGKVFHYRVMSNNIYLEDELLRFPRGQHDDVIDALSYTLSLYNKPREQREYFENRYLY